MTTDRNHRADATLLMFCSFGTATSNSLIFAAIGDLQDTYGFSSSGLGAIAGMGFLSGLMVQMFIAPLGDRGHSKRLIMTGLLLGAIGSTLFALGSSLPVFVVARGIIGSAFGFVFPAVRSLIAHVDPERRGERLGRLGEATLVFVRDDHASALLQAFAGGGRADAASGGGGDENRFSVQQSVTGYVFGRSGHGSALLHFGSPRTRSPRTLRWISFEPP